MIKERRLRLRRREDILQGYAKMNSKTMKDLNIQDKIEVVIGGKKRLYFKVIPQDNIPLNEVWCNEEELRARGVADNTIATVRASIEREG